MSSLITFPNSFKSDDSTVDSNFLYSFNASVDISSVDLSSADMVLSHSLYKQIQVPNEISNVKFNFSEYSFYGIYLTNQKDDIDHKVSGSHVLLIECKNHKLDKYLFISIPLTDSDTETNINTLFHADTRTLEDINYFIPSEEGFYSYVTTGIQTKESTVILYTKSNLRVKKIGTLPPLKEQKIQPTPLTLSAVPGTQVSMITASANLNDIYIDCQPVEETNSEKKVITMNHMDNINIYGVSQLFNQTYIVLFIIGMCIFIFIGSILILEKKYRANSNSNS